MWNRYAKSGSCFTCKVADLLVVAADIPLETGYVFGCDLMHDSPHVDLDRLHSIKGMKWTKYEKDVIPAFVADMDFEPPHSAYNALKEMVELKDFGYKFNHIDRLMQTLGLQAYGPTT